MVFLPSTIPSRMARINLASALQPGGDPGPVSVLIGVDTHRDFHVAVALSLQGSLLGEMHLPACMAGYEALLDWHWSSLRAERPPCCSGSRAPAATERGFHAISRLPNAACVR